MNEGCKWYVLRTHAHAETQALEHLRRHDFEAYLPRFWREPRHARRRETIVAPLFPRYCFVAFDLTRQRWHAIRSTLGVERLIGGESNLTSVRDEVVDGPMRRENAESGVVMEPRPRFSAGDPVRLVGGGFSFCSTLFESTTDRDRVAGLLEILGRCVRVVVDGTAVAVE